MRRLSPSPLLLPALLLALSLAAARAGAQTASVGGRVVGAGDGAPVAYALVRLQPEEPELLTRTTLSGEDGAFHFPGVAPGRYRLSLERIGFSAESTEPFAVEEGGAVEWTLRSAARPIVIQGITARAACYTGAELERDAELASLWREAQKGIETKRAFDGAYRYTYETHQYLNLHPHRRRDPPLLDTLVERIVNDPALPVRHEGGYGFARADTLRLDLPDGRVILDPAFLSTHCLESGFETSDDGTAWELSFRPVRPQRGRIDIRGTVRVDRRTFQLHSMTLEYLDGTRSFARVEILHQDAKVPGGTLRFPVVAFIDARPIGRLRRVFRHIDGRLVYANYGNLERVAGAAPP
jgi:protocatechuate 3,4-dioxygenase beta subunit